MSKSLETLDFTNKLKEVLYKTRKNVSNEEEIQGFTSENKSFLFLFLLMNPAHVWIFWMRFEILI